MRQVVSISGQNGSLVITYDNGDFFTGRINLEQLASFIENEYNASDSELEPIGYNPDAEALASAGLGTDEDYGYFGGEE